MKLYSVFMTWVASKLCNQGFPIVHMGRNQKNPQFMVYQFEDTPAFQKALARVMNESKLADEVENYGRERTKNGAVGKTDATNK